MPIKQERQYRSMSPLTVPLEPTHQKRFESDFYVEGYATTFEPYVLFHDENGDPIYEQILPTAFGDCDMTDVIFQYDHVGKVFARNRNNTLLLEVHPESGLFIAGDLSKTTSSRLMYEDINTGLVDRMSWCFRPDYNTLEYNEETRTIIHHKIIKIYDVSAVSIPANDATEISSRSLVDGEIEKVKQELLRREHEKQKLLLKLKLGGI
ncbi:MAG: HK97 family phage prohead protease [Clostridia bacterium]|nr:HK97 family phage prohead protease [Clostridia bacterium]